VVADGITSTIFILHLPCFNGKRKKITSQACGLVYLVFEDFIRDRQRD